MACVNTAPLSAYFHPHDEPNSIVPKYMMTSKWSRARGHDLCVCKGESQSHPVVAWDGWCLHNRLPALFLGFGCLLLPVPQNSFAQMASPEAAASQVLAGLGKAQGFC